MVKKSTIQVTPPKTPLNNLSVIILVGGKINSLLLEKCIDSASWASEVLKVETKNLRGGFAAWRNEGAKVAKGDWILYIDADEEITKNLRMEILKIIENWSLETHQSGYAIPRRNFIFGKEFKHSGEWPDYQKRLFLKKNFKGFEGRLHEEPHFLGNIGYLKNPILHHKDITISEMLVKTNEWSEIEAKLMFEAGHPPMNIFRFFSAGLREFWNRMIQKMAFLDGRKGVIYAMYQVYSRLISYTKLWEMQLINSK